MLYVFTSLEPAAVRDKEPETAVTVHAVSTSFEEALKKGYDSLVAEAQIDFGPCGTDPGEPEILEERLGRINAGIISLETDQKAEPDRGCWKGWEDAEDPDVRLFEIQQLNE